MKRVRKAIKVVEPDFEDDDEDEQGFIKVSFSDSEDYNPKHEGKKFKKSIRRNTTYVPLVVFSQIREPSIQNNNSFNLPYSLLI